MMTPRLADTSGRSLTARLLPRLAAGAALAATFAAPAAALAAAGGIEGLGANPGDAERALRDHTLQMLDGSVVELGGLRGQVVIVNFWASWCPPCRREMPRLNGLKTELDPIGARVVAVSIDENLENVRRFCRAQGVAVPVAHDGPNGLARTLDLGSVPLSLVLDRGGHIVYTTSRSDAKAMSRLAAAAREAVAAPAPASGPAAGDQR